MSIKLYDSVLRNWFIKRSGKGMDDNHSHAKLTNVDQVYINAHGHVVAATTDGKLHRLAID